MNVLVALVILLVLVGAVFVFRRKSVPENFVEPEPARPPIDAEVIAARRGGIVLLRDNDWTHCVFDGLRTDWNAKTRQGVRGFAQVPSGRHRAQTQGRSGGEVVHDFVLYPGETYVRRLDVTAFVSDDPETEANYKRLARGGSVGSMGSALVDYRMELMLLGEGPEDLSLDLDAVLVRIGRIVSQAAEGQDVLEEARGFGLGLIGRLATRGELQKIASRVDLVASAQAMSGGFDNAVRAAEVGLVILPGDPVLLDLLANLRSDSGDPAGALPLVDAALNRPEALGPGGMEKARATKAKIVAALAASQP